MDMCAIYVQYMDKAKSKSKYIKISSFSKGTPSFGWSKHSKTHVAPPELASSNCRLTAREHLASEAINSVMGCTFITFSCGTRCIISVNYPHEEMLPHKTQQKSRSLNCKALSLVSWPSSDIPIVSSVFQTKGGSLELCQICLGKSLPVTLELENPSLFRCCGAVVSASPDLPTVLQTQCLLYQPPSTSKLPIQSWCHHPHARSPVLEDRCPPTHLGPGDTKETQPIVNVKK